MRRKLVFTCLAAALFSVVASRSAEATEVGYNRTFGLGFELGDPTAIVGKYWVSKTNALDFGIGFWGYSWGYCTHNNPCNAGYQNYSFHLDYLWQSNLVKTPAVQLDWHIGVGGRAIIWNNGDGSSDFALGGRMPVGLDSDVHEPELRRALLRDRAGGLRPVRLQHRSRPRRALLLLTRHRAGSNDGDGMPCAVMRPRRARTATPPAISMVTERLEPAG